MFLTMAKRFATLYSADIFFLGLYGDLPQFSMKPQL